MPHRHPHKTAHRVKPKYKKLALIAAAAAVLSTTTLPGMPASTAHAATNTMSATTSQQVGKTTESSIQINAERSQSPISPTTTKPEKKPAQAKETAKKSPAQSQKSAKKNNQKNNQENTQENNTKPTTEKPPKESGKKAEPEKTKTNPPEVNKNDRKDQPNPPKNEEEKTPSSSDNAPSHYKEVFDISATAYAPGPHDNEQWGNKTHIGTEVRPGIIAVDPKLIPLGSRVYIEYPDGHGEYATAEDTGGAIKGNRIDVAKQTVSEAQDFGIQKVKVYVVNTPKNA